MSGIKTHPWSPTNNLNFRQEIIAYLNAAFEEEDPALVAAALGDISRSKGMAELARETGLGRESLYKALSSEGNPKLSTVMQVIKALRVEVACRVTFVEKFSGERCEFR